MKRWLRAVFMAMLIVNGLIVLSGFYMAFWPMEALKINSRDRILNPNRTVRAGDALTYRIDYCKYTTKQAVVTRLLKGDVNYSLPASTNNIPAGCRTAISRNTIIPDGVEPGMYRLELSASYQMNPLRTITVTHDTEAFTVVAKDAPEAAQALPSAVVGSSSAQGVATPLAASPLPYGTDPVTQEPTQPQPTPQPDVFSQVMSIVKSALGIR